MSSALRGGFGLDWGCAWGQRPQLGWLPPTCHPRTPTPLLAASVPLPPAPLLSPSTLPYALYAKPRCGRRRLGQVRLSLGFNIGENTGFYLIARATFSFSLFFSAFPLLDKDETLSNAEESAPVRERDGGSRTKGDAYRK